MPSHREAPEISKDPVADSSDLYAFVSPDQPDTVTLIATYVPTPVPAGATRFCEFADDVLYEIHVDANGDARPDLTYQFRFRTELRDDGTFLYNTGPIESLDSPNWNRRQFYSVTRVDAHGKSAVLAAALPCPPCNVGPLSIPDYGTLAAAAVHTLASGETVFAGQRADMSYADPGAVFDLGPDVYDGLGAPAAALNVHAIAIQLPVDLVRRDGTGPVIGVWTSAARRRLEVGPAAVDVGPYAQISRRGNPLVSEVLIPADQKERFHSLPPSEDKRFASFVEEPWLADVLPGRYPGRFDRLEQAATPRADLVALLLTGIPEGPVDGFVNRTGEVQADMLRLNTAVPPSPEENPFGLLGGDLAGFPNGRRIGDDVVSIVLRAVAGATVPLVDEAWTPDPAASDVRPGLTPRDVRALPRFPYLALP
jgi:hypothetical protein